MDQESEKTGHRAISEDLSDSPSGAKQTPDRERLWLYEFGPFRLDPTERTLLRGNEIVPLTPKAFDTLYLLVRNSGHMLEKDEMIRALWPDTFVEEGSLSNNIFLLRKALGENPSFIETVPRRGYRFVGAALQLPHAAPPHLEEPSGDHPELAKERSRVSDPPLETGEIPGGETTSERRDAGRDKGLLRWLLPGTAALAALLAAAIWYLHRPLPPPIRATLELTPAEHLTNDRFGRPHHTAMAFSPDGEVLVFAGTAGTTRQLYKRPLDQAEAVPIPGTEGGDGPFFSPDGKWLGFYADNSLKKVSTSGGPAVPICKLDGTLWGATWGADGSIVFAEAEHDLQQVSAQGGEPKVLLKTNEGDSWYASPEFLPDGRTLLFTNVHGWNWDHAEILVLPNGGSPRILLKGGASPVYASAGYLIYLRSGALLAAPFDVRHLELTGPGVPLLDGVMQSIGAPNSDYESGIGQFAVSRLGTLVYAGGGIYAPYTGSMVRLDRSGAAVDLHFKDPAYGLRLSPDGRRLVAVKRATNSRAVNVELYDLERGTSTPLTFDGVSGWPIWSADGQRVLFATVGPKIDSVAADGRGARETVFSKESDFVTPASWSRDGRWLAILLEHAGHPKILVCPMAEKREPQVFRESASNTSAHLEIFDAEFSPDSKWIAYSSTETGATEVYVQAFPGPGEKHRISANGGMNPAWAPSGRELFYLEPNMPGDIRRGSKMMAVDIDDLGSFRAGAPHELFTVQDGLPRTPIRSIPVRSYDVYPDGRHFIVSLPEHQTDLPVARLNVVLNWFDELKRRVPTR